MCLGGWACNGTTGEHRAVGWDTEKGHDGGLDAAAHPLGGARGDDVATMSAPAAGSLTFTMR